MGTELERFRLLSKLPGSLLDSALSFCFDEAARSAQLSPYLSILLVKSFALMGKRNNCMF